MVNPAGKGRSR